MTHKLYKVTNLIMKIKGYIVSGLAFLTMNLSFVFIFNGNKLINDANNNSSGSIDEGAINCSTAFVGAFLKALGVMMLICAIVAIVLGITYVFVSRKMKKLEGKSKKPVLILFILELISIVGILVLLVLNLTNDSDFFLYLVLLMGLTQCTITSILLGKLLSYENIEENV